MPILKMFLIKHTITCNVYVYSGTSNGFNRLTSANSMPNGDLGADRKHGWKQKGLFKTFGEVFR